MKHSTRGIGSILACVAVFGLLMLATGCPTKSEPAQLTTVFTADGAPLGNAVKAALDETLKGETVAIEDIESLTVTIEEIRVHHACDDAEVEEPVEGDKDEEGEVEEEDDCGEWITIFPGEEGETLRVNLLELTEVNQIITVDELPAGTYTKIELSIVDPELVLVSSSPDPVDAEIKTTANGRLFVSKNFELEEGSMGLLQIDFGGIHLVMAGDKYVLTPQLRAEVSLLSAEDTIVTGELQNLNAPEDTFEVVVEGGIITVDCEGAVVYLETDTDTPTGSKADLADGQIVEVEGRLYADNSMEAVSVRILPPPPPPAP